MVADAVKIDSKIILPSDRCSLRRIRTAHILWVKKKIKASVAATLSESESSYWEMIIERNYSVASVGTKKYLLASFPQEMGEFMVYSTMPHIWLYIANVDAVRK